MKATVIKFYSDTPAGTTGVVLKTWREPKGTPWAMLCFGKNQGGQKLKKSFPLDCLNIMDILVSQKTEERIHISLSLCLSDARLFSLLLNNNVTIPEHVQNEFKLTDEERYKLQDIMGGIFEQIRNLEYKKGEDFF